MSNVNCQHKYHYGIISGNEYALEEDIDELDENGDHPTR